MKVTDLDARRAATARSGIAKVAGKFKSSVKDDNLRPSRLDSFIGQTDTVNELTVMVRAARMEERQLDHVLMTGPGGLGKTTMALMLANEMEAPLIATTAPTLGQEPLVRMLSGMDPGTVIFIDEIHRLSKRTEELMYAAMEDGVIDANTPAGPVRRKLEPFTVVGATTLPGKMSESFKDRFGHTAQLRHYSVSELKRIVERSCGVLKLEVTEEAALMVAERSRGVARVANNYVRRLRDYALTKSEPELSEGVAEKAFTLFGIDELGLDRLGRNLLRALRDRFASGPVGVENLALAMGGEDTNTINNDVEPYLCKLGLIIRSPRGRVLTEEGAQHLRDVEELD